MAKRITIAAGDVFLVVDVQNDFCPGGLLPVPKGDEIVAPVNQLARRFEHVVLTQDWHPRGHHSFASSHQGRKPYETIQAPYGPQILWPDHCIQETRGAEVHADLQISHAELILRKGFRPHIDSYSAFFENDRKTPTGLAGYLRERGFTRVFLAGLAFDCCVRYSAEDAQRQGFSVAIIEDACRALGVAGSLEAAHRSFAELGIPAFEASVILQPASQIRLFYRAFGQNGTRKFENRNWAASVSAALFRVIGRLVGDGLRLSVSPEVTKDTSPTAESLKARNPPGKALPLIYLVIGILSIPSIWSAVQELLRRHQYGGVI